MSLDECNKSPKGFITYQNQNCWWISNTIINVKICLFGERHSTPSGMIYLMCCHKHFRVVYIMYVVAINSHIQFYILTKTSKLIYFLYLVSLLQIPSCISYDNMIEELHECIRKKNVCLDINLLLILIWQNLCSLYRLSGSIQELKRMKVNLVMCKIFGFQLINKLTGKVLRKYHNHICLFNSHHLVDLSDSEYYTERQN